MAKSYEVIEYEGKPARLYADGSIRDERGRAMAKPPFFQEITADNARDMVRRREEKRHRLYAEGAQLAVEDMRLVRKYGEDAHIVARARTLQQIAETPDAGKAAVMAAAQLDKAQGYDIKAEDTPSAGDAPVTQALVLMLEAVTRRLAQQPAQVRDVIDADIAPASGAAAGKAEKE